MFADKDKVLKDCLLILFLTAIIYLPFLGELAWEGNEPIRVIVAKGMMEKGNWMIPMLHGNPYFTKPPLMNWIIAASGNLFGILNEWTSRLPSVLMILLTGISVYFLTSRWLTREGSLFASISTISMVELISKGRTAEIDGLFVFLIVLTLLVWINGYLRQWKPATLWSISLTLVGIGFLAKGPQAIAYFYLTIFGYLLVKKRLRFFFSISHLVGILCFIVVLAVYLSFVLEWVSLDKYLKMWQSQITERAESDHVLSFFTHLVSYPADAVWSFLPCSLFIIPLILYKDLRKKTKELFKNEMFMFSFVMVVMNFPLYWLLPNARFRYFLPAGPFVAIVIAALFELYLNTIKEQHAISSFFHRLLKTLSWAAVMLALAVTPLIWYLKLGFTIPLILLLVSVFLIAVFILLRLPAIPVKRTPFLLAILTGLFFLIYTNIDVQSETRNDNYPKKIAQEINLLLPHDIQTVYEIGYRRFLGTTCYLPQEVIQLGKFSELKDLRGKGNRIYFIFDMKFLNSTRNKEEQRVLLEDIQWERVYSKFYSSSRGEIVVGYLK